MNDLAHAQTCPHCGETRDCRLRPRFSPPAGAGRLGFTLIPIVKRIGPFELLAVNAFGLVLTCVVAGEHWPETPIGFGPPPGWPVNVIRQVMRWPPGAALPVTMVLAR